MKRCKAGMWANNFPRDGERCEEKTPFVVAMGVCGFVRVLRRRKVRLFVEASVFRVRDNAVRVLCANEECQLVLVIKTGKSYLFVARYERRAR